MHRNLISAAVLALAGLSAQPVIAAPAAGSADQATIAKPDAYAGANLAVGSRRDADTAIAGIRDRIKVRAERLPAIDAWLAAHAK